MALRVAPLPEHRPLTRFFRRFTAKQVTQTLELLLARCLARLPERAAGYTLDRDSSVFER